MSFKAIIVILCLVTFCADAAEEIVAPSNSSHRQSRFNNFFMDFLLPPVCTGCPPRYCDADPAIILGYCCGCRRTFDILPIYCTPNIFCPPHIRDVCHDYEYMLHCCC